VNSFQFTKSTRLILAYRPKEAVAVVKSASKTNVGSPWPSTAYGIG
jgi:hypothetical protein